MYKKTDPMISLKKKKKKLLELYKGCKRIISLKTQHRVEKERHRSFNS